MTASTPRKPAGGITAAAITPAGNLLRAALGADGRAEAVFRDGTPVSYTHLTLPTILLV